MSVPLRRNPRRQCRPIEPVLTAPVPISIHSETFRDAIFALGSTESTHHYHEIQQLLNRQAGHGDHLCIIHIIAALQRKLRKHALTSGVNYQILLPVPQFRGPFSTEGPAYAIGNF